ncbi:MAG TPA: GNAT family N-acetyltransferase [Catenuloplanes sp.]|jgi:CelD/BcsL family acetyltransferase involved in cellulose biosynthesis
MTLEDIPVRQQGRPAVVPVGVGGPGRATVLLDDFAAVGDQWGDLLARDSAATFFSSLEWLSCWWAAHGDDQRLLIAALLDGDRLVAVAPLMSRREHGIPVVRFVGTGDSDYGGIVVDDAVSRPDAVFALLDRVRTALPLAVFDLREVSDADPLLAILGAWSRARAGGVRTVVSSACPYIPLPADVRAHDAELGGAARQQERRRLRRLGELGTVEISDDLAHGGGVEQLMDEFGAVEDSHPRADERGNRWTDGRRAFLGAVLHASTATGTGTGTGRVWLQGIRVDSRLIAYSVAFRQGATLYSYVHGFHGDYSRHSPGRLLHLHIRRSAIAEGITRFDLLRGAEPYKLLLTDRQWVNSRVLLWPRPLGPARLRVLTGVWRLTAYDELRRVPVLRWCKEHLALLPGRR